MSRFMLVANGFVCGVGSMVFIGDVIAGNLWHLVLAALIIAVNVALISLNLATSR